MNINMSSKFSNITPDLGRDQKGVDESFMGNGVGGNDRQVLEQNLERLISERGMEVIGQLTKEMSPQQIERLLIQTKQKLQATNSAPLVSSMASPLGE